MLTMKIKTRLAIAFLIITVVPISLIYLAMVMLNNYQGKMFSQTYGLSEEVDLTAGGSIRIFNRLTESIQREIDREIETEPEKFGDGNYLADLNGRLSMKHSFLAVRKDEELSFTGNESITNELRKDLISFSALESVNSWGYYLDSGTEHLIKQRDFSFPDGASGSVFVVTNVADMIPEARTLALEIVFTSIIILLITGVCLTAWVYQSIWRPLGKLQEATRQIRDGNLDFTLEAEEDDEIGGSA